MKTTLAKIAHKYGLSLFILFGSAATKTMRTESDVDIAVVSRKPLSLSKELALRHALTSIFKREIDLVFLDHASPLLLGQIARDGKLLFGAKKDFTALRVRAIKAYIDFKPYFELRARTIHKTLTTHYA